MLETGKSVRAARRPAATAASARARKATPANGAAAPSSGKAPSNTIDRIVDAAAHLFATHGYVSATLDEVASHAGFTKGAVYYYFKDKESLLLEVLQRIEQRSIVKTARTVDEFDGDAAHRLEVFVKTQTRWAGQYPEDLAILMLMSAETAHTPQRVRAQMQSVYAKMAATLESIIEQGKRSGEFSTAQDTRDTVLYLQAVHDGNMMVWYRSGTDPAIGKRIVRVTLAGFQRAVRG